MSSGHGMACPPANANALRILTWNVNGLRPMLNRNVYSLSRMLRELQADIICIQETKVSKSDMNTLHTLGTAEGW